MILKGLNRLIFNTATFSSVFCVLFILFSCQSKTRNRLVGLWALELDSCIVSNRDWVFCSNSMIIDEDNTCKLPILCTQRYDQSKGSWQIIRGRNQDDSVIFVVPDSPLSGRYLITFYKDYKTMKFNMKLENDSILLVCTKSVVSFTSTPKEALEKE